ncbi:hypothetical protein [Niabella beijingensis]|uniref:hypothetical protein n=1 Tax=Niabella beijingensis TaxID=2872700 RepID=UPI001CBD5828|nr:hypothetical protein [Niabella beijingensis]MBZ4192317.1 hypothetical protein [Niabella beijingensis]
MKKIQHIHLLLVCISLTACSISESQEKTVSVPGPVPAKPDTVQTASAVVPEAVLDTSDYKKRMKDLANGDSSGRWPVKAPLPLPGAIFPFNRVIAYYGNLYSKGMGILGELPKKAMLQKLKNEVGRWEKADPGTPVVPALHYIAVTAQGAPGRDGKYRLRMPFHQIDTVLKWSKEIDALTFIDVQVGQSTLQEEIPRFKKYFKLPGFHLGIDPEFSMKDGATPGTRIGSFNADDINFVIDYLAEIVRDNELPPKILVIHRFTQDMVMGYKDIKKVPEVQVVIDMDGWGGKPLKTGTYNTFVYRQPVQFTGFKLFYKNDLKGGSTGLFTPKELLRFKPRPVYIQYQ